MQDQYGFVVENTPFDEMRVVEPFRLNGTTFEGTNIDPNFWTSFASGVDASITQTNGSIILVSGTDSSGTTYIETVRKARYSAAASNRFRSQVICSDLGTGSNVRRWGCFDSSNGAFFELDSSSLKIVTRKIGIDTSVGSESWNVNTSVPTLTDINTYEIYITNKSAYFVINGSMKHRVTSSSAWSASKNLHCRAENINVGATTSQSLEILVMSIVRLGKGNTETTYKYISSATTTVLKYSQGKIHKVIHGGSAANVITLVDNFTGTTPVIAVINGQNNVPSSFDFGNEGVPFFRGLSVITSASGNVTIIYE